MSRYDLDFTFDANLIAEWVDAQSDFAFELKVVETLHALCAQTHFSATITHGGSYVDPVSGKHREHDVLFYAPSDTENVPSHGVS